MQAVAPTMVVGLSDSAGRRPAYLVCFVIYIAANIGLAFQKNYVALMVLRCLQCRQERHRGSFKRRRS